MRGRRFEANMARFVGARWSGRCDRRWCGGRAASLGDHELVQSRGGSSLENDCRNIHGMCGRCRYWLGQRGRSRRRDCRRRRGSRRAKLAAKALAQKDGVFAECGAKAQRGLSARDRAIVHAADAFVNDEAARRVDAISRRRTASSSSGGGRFGAGIFLDKKIYLKTRIKC